MHLQTHTQKIVGGSVNGINYKSERDLSLFVGRMYQIDQGGRPIITSEFAPDLAMCIFHVCD